MNRRRFLLLSAAGALPAADISPARIETEGVSAEVGADGSLRVTVTDPFDRYPSAILHPPDGPWDWSAYERLTVPVKNIGSRKTNAMAFAFTAGGWGGISSFPEHENGRHALEPGESTQISLRLQQRMPGAVSTTIHPGRVNYLRYIAAGGQPGDVLEFGPPVLSGTAPETPPNAARLEVPLVEAGTPAPGKRVRMTLRDFPGIPYVLFLPPGWTPGKRYPMICEYPGNIFFHKDCHSTGRTDQGNIGYGMCQGEGFIWVNLPFVAEGRMREQLDGWGDPRATAEFARLAVREICERWGGDPSAVILTGFSRGGMAASLIGLGDPQTADVWLAFHAVQGGDGSGWRGANRRDAILRARRLQGRWAFLTESDPWIAPLRLTRQRYVSVHSGMGAHTDVMFLDDRPSTRQLRQWLAEVVAKKPGTRAVTGRILDSRGQPLAGVRVASGFTHFAITDARGHYRLEGLTGRQRTLSLERNGKPVASRAVVLTAPVTTAHFRV